ncbi:U-box domain-containing protein 11 isoform A [Glycine soja]|uniref:U-box domain-containing protein 11 isoform A n=1 Tax=Glycine soja TaxID=3848 RepID=A0A445L2X7_GLYSO|nr:U-box domain-containing protein 11 isoform A [Glycine soja]
MNKRLSFLSHNEKSKMKDSTETDAISDSLELLSTFLDSELPSVRNFKGKWSLARVKLTQLQTHLTDFSAEFPNASTTNPLSLHLLHSIFKTLNDAVSLSRSCQPQTLPNGKLKTQSDLDSLLATLDRHVSDCDILFRSGLLLENDAVSVSVSVSSKREAIRSESRNLITRLQIGSPESKASAMDSLLGLLQEDDKNVTIAVAQGVVPVLVRLLDSPPSDTKEKTVAAISKVSTVESAKSVLLAEGLLLLNHLLRVLDSGSGFAIEKACIALRALSLTKENARAIGSRGGISSLLEICQAGTPGAQASAAAVLRNLAAFEEIRDNFVEENAVVVLIALASSGTAVARENAVGCLSNLINSDSSSEETEGLSNLRITVVKEGGVECLKNYWDSGTQIQSLEVAVVMLRHLAESGPIGEVLVGEGFVQRLVGVLNREVLAVRIAAARAVYALGLNSGRARKEMGELGCVLGLIKMLDGKGVEEKEASAMALSVLLMHPANRRVFRKDERGVVSAVHLLNPSLQGLDKKYPVSLLALLVHSKSCRKQMVAAGACVYTQKLVEMDVPGSKKFLESLGRGLIL